MNINDDIDKIEHKISSYIWNKLFITGKEKKFLTKLLSETDILLFGGVIRELIFNNYIPLKHRDVDLVILSYDENIRKIIDPYLKSINSFGGFKLEIDDKSIDLWKLEDTWAIRDIPLFNEKKYLPYTSFFNINAITYSLGNSEVIMSDGFKEFLQNNILDIEFRPNPLPELCFIKTYEYKIKYNLTLSERLISFLNDNINEEKFSQINLIQLKHFGFQKYCSADLLSFLRDVKK